MRRRLPRERWLRRAAIVVAACAAAACARGGEANPGAVPTAPTTGAPAAAQTANATADPASERIGQFVARCPYSHRSLADPIVFPHGDAGHGAHDGSGHGAAPHSHDFFGNTTTDEHATTASLLASKTTTCDLAEDLSSYWAPTLSRGGVALEADEFVAYYDSAPGIEPSSVAPIPDGLVMIAGNDTRPDAPKVTAAGWTCGRERSFTVDAPSCLLGAPLTLRVNFPDCWNGRDVDSADHRSHVAYSTDGACPASHPVPIVRLVLRVRYPIYGDPSDLTLSSGPLSTAHADFMNAWTTSGMREFVDLCIHRRVACGVA